MTAGTVNISRAVILAALTHITNSADELQRAEENPRTGDLPSEIAEELDETRDLIDSLRAAVDADEVSDGSDLPEVEPLEWKDDPFTRNGYHLSLGGKIVGEIRPFGHRWLWRFLTHEDYADTLKLAMSQANAHRDAWFAQAIPQVCGEATGYRTYTNHGFVVSKTPLKETSEPLFSPPRAATTQARTADESR
jgi:hypothetical protein